MKKGHYYIVRYKDCLGEWYNDNIYTIGRAREVRCAKIKNGASWAKIIRKDWTEKEIK